MYFTHWKWVLLRQMCGVCLKLCFSALFPPTPPTVNVDLSCSSIPKWLHISTAGSNYSGAEKSHLHWESPWVKHLEQQTGKVLRFWCLWSSSNMSLFSSYNNSVHLVLWGIAALLHCKVISQGIYSFLHQTQLEMLNNHILPVPATLWFYITKHSIESEIIGINRSRPYQQLRQTSLLLGI